MTIQQLEYLVAVAQNPSISQAAEQFYVAQSSISKAIKALESELGFALLERHYNGVVFTPKGEEFLREAYSLVANYHMMQEHYLKTEYEESRFSVSSQHYIFVLEAVSRLLSGLEDRYQIDLRETRTSEIIREVASRISQIGFIYYYASNKDFLLRELRKNDLTFHPFCTLQPHIYCALDHPLAEQPFVTQDQLTNYPYVCYYQGADAVEFTEEILSPLHCSQLIQVQDRASLFKIMTHSSAYSLGSGLLRDGFIESNIATVPVMTPLDNATHIGWITLKGQEPVSGSIGDQFLTYCQESLRQCYTGHPRKDRKSVPASTEAF